MLTYYICPDTNATAPANWTPNKLNSHGDQENTQKITFIKNQNIYIKMRLFISLGIKESWRLWNDHPATSRENQHSHRIPERLKRCDAYWQGRKKNSSTGNATWSMTWMDFEGKQPPSRHISRNQHSHRTPERQNNYHAYSTGQKKSWSTDMVVNVTW